MRQYEILLMIHPNHSERIGTILERYTQVIQEHNGRILRQEDWGRLHLSYSIQKQTKAHYILLNIELNNEGLDKLKHLFRFNDALLRHFILLEDFDGSEGSIFLANQKAEHANQEKRAGRREAQNRVRVEVEKREAAVVVEKPEVEKPKATVETAVEVEKHEAEVVVAKEVVAKESEKEGQESVAVSEVKPSELPTQP